MSKRVFNFEALNEAIQRDNATLIGTYDKVNKRTTVQFKCKCGEDGHKSSLQIINRAGAFCKKCTYTKSAIKLQQTRSTEKKVVCSLESLQEVLKRDNATLLMDYEVIKSNTPISFKCHCGEDYIKNSAQLIKVSGAFCKTCTRKTWTEKNKKTNLEKYGVECSVHAPHISERIKQERMDKYGVDNLFKLPEIQEKIKKTILEKYGVECISQVPEIRQKAKQTCIQKYGGENPMFNESVKQKLKETLINKYGVQHISQSQEFKDKYKQTCLERYGVEHASKSDQYKEKVKKSFIERFGVDNPNKTQEIKDKIKKTNLERYGVEYSSQNHEIMEKTQKNAKKYKEYTMPSGQIIKVQGYEPFALNELVKIYKEDDIKTGRKDIPRIKYEVDGKSKYYFPDIYLPIENKIIEVKSTWTYKCKTDNIKQKSDAVKQAGYNYEIWIYDTKGNKMDLSTL